MLPQRTPRNSLPEHLLPRASLRAVCRRIEHQHSDLRVEGPNPSRLATTPCGGPWFQDRARPGYSAAIDAATRMGFAAVERLAGGKAAVFHEGTIAFAWTTPHPDPKTGIAERFRAISSIIVEALSRLGVTGTVGEVRGEYCPGRFSVQVGGRKVMGVGQRLVKSAAHVGGVLVAHSPELVNLPLVPVYEALGYEWRPEATGAIGNPVDDVIGALTGAFTTAGLSLQRSQFDQETAAVAANIAERHLPRIS